jgi:hypothetical protein
VLLNLLVVAVEAVAGEGIVAVRQAASGDVLVLIEGPRAAWPVGFAALLTDQAAALSAVLEAEASALQAPLSALISHASGIRVRVLLGPEGSRPAPLVVELGKAE